jgi:hypothetical protein
MMQKFSKLFIEKARAVAAKRPKTVIDHILAHGQITTDELKVIYGYNHPPRAARDVREQGVALKTIRVEGPDGRRIGAYVFDESGGSNYSKRGGRTALSNKLKMELIQLHGSRCFIYLEPVAERELQIDHRIPYEVAGDASAQSQDASDFMLLCGSANRAKSWSCEHCPNWLGVKNLLVCRSCYWAYPESYSHVATLAQRRLDIVWAGEEVAEYGVAQKEATKADKTMPDFVKTALRMALKNRCE